MYMQSSTSSVKWYHILTPPLPPSTDNVILYTEKIWACIEKLLEQQRTVQVMQRVTKAACWLKHHSIRLTEALQ